MIDDFLRLGIGVFIVLVIVAAVSAVSADAAQPSQGQPAQAPSTAAVGDDQARREAQVLFREVMSPFCPGLTLADCPSPAAFELRREIQARLERGEPRDAIVDGLVAQYGTELLADPSDTPIGRVVWGVPILLSALAAVVLAVFVRRATRAHEADVSDPAPASAQLRDRVDEELAALD